ncbi:MAG: hypothetical protein ABSD64_12785 [Terriglobales bacterium]|jgi:hypothetical protein
MNPLASTKCAGRLLLALAAIASILLMAGCGSSSSVTPVNPVGFTNGSLKGTYVFSVQGADASGYPLALAGTLVADGNTGITGGTMDVIDPFFDTSPNTPPSPAAQPITPGSYAVGADGRGQISLTTAAYGTYILDFVLTSPSQGLVSEFDANGNGSGTIDLQTAVTSLSQLAQPYAFSLAGSDSGLFPFATTGAFTLNSSGASTAGVEDFNDNAVPINQGSLTAAATVGSGTGPGTITLTSNFGPLLFDYYPTDATHFKLIETDYDYAYLAGDVFTQVAASIPTGPMVFTMAGGTTASGPVADGGLMTSDGTGNFSGGLEDANNDGDVPPQLSFTGALDAAASGPTGGRVFVNLSGSFFPATNWVIYPSSGGLLMLEADHANVTSGAGYAQQTGATLAASQNFGLNLSAIDLGNGSGIYEEDDIAQFLTTGSGFSGAVDINDGGETYFGQSLDGAYTLDSPATGRGEATTTAAGSSFVDFIFYAVSNDQFLLLETDGNQIGAGTFATQNSGVNPNSRRVIVHPAVRPHAAARRK